ncbi:ABC transporter ATP-binding protein [Streptomyces sp. NPDC006923]|uniref:ABC transporter ATP-binding protein n=1 Tax=Streptomyces sp. NPDC006923 TaxID=3155355 RepID=UPI0033EFE060
MNTTRPTEFAVVVDGLVKRYPGRETPAVDGLSFTVPHGEVFGFLGPNGAGKTTTLGVLTTRVRPTGGKAFVQGVDVVARPALARQSFAVVPQRNNLDRSLTIRQNLTFHAGYHGLSRADRNRLADETLEWIGLADHRKARADQVSGGQAQRVMIGRALMHRPRVLFLDEPTTGLDPQSQLFLHERVADLSGRGVTVVITTHNMEEAAKLCDRVGIVDHGKLLALDSPRNLVESISNTTLTLTVTPPGSGIENVVAALRGLALVERVEILRKSDEDGDNVPPDGGSSPGAAVRLRVYSDADSAAILPAAIKIAADAHCDINDLRVGRASLEDVFVELTGKELR